MRRVRVVRAPSFSGQCRGKKAVTNNGATHRWKGSKSRATTQGKLHFDAGGPHPAVQAYFNTHWSPRRWQGTSPGENFFTPAASDWIISFRFQWYWQICLLESASQSGVITRQQKPRLHCRYDPLHLHLQHALTAELYTRSNRDPRAALNLILRLHDLRRRDRIAYEKFFMSSRPMHEPPISQRLPIRIARCDLWLDFQAAPSPFLSTPWIARPRK